LLFLQDCSEFHAQTELPLPGGEGPVGLAEAGQRIALLVKAGAEKARIVCPVKEVKDLGAHG